MGSSVDEDTKSLSLNEYVRKKLRERQVLFDAGLPLIQPILNDPLKRK